MAFAVCTGRRLAAFVLALIAGSAAFLAVGTPAQAATSSPRFTINSLPSHGAYNVDRTRTYNLTARAKHRPQYVDAAPYPQRPSGYDYYFHKDGRGYWQLSVTMTKSLKSHTYWNIGIRTGHTIHRLKIRVLGKNDPRGAETGGSGPHQG